MLAAGLGVTISRSNDAGDGRAVVIVGHDRRQSDPAHARG